MSDFVFRFAPDSSLGLIILGAVVALAGFGLGVWILRREVLSVRFRAALYTLRILSLILLCLLLAPLLIKFRHTGAGRTSVLVLVDESQSMNLNSRIDKTREALNAVLPALRRRGDVELAKVGGPYLQPVADIDQKPTADSTDLAAAFSEAKRWFAGRSLDAVVLVSDGRITAGGSPQVAASALGVPVFTAGFDEGTTQESLRDLAILGVDAPQTSLVGNTVRVEATLRATGLDPAKHAVEVLEGSRVIGKSEAVFLKDVRETRTDFTFIPQREGRHVYTVRVTPVADETVTRNNEFAFVLNVESARRRVLVVESQWRQEYRYIKRAIEEDPNLKFTGFLRVKEGQFKQQVEPTEVAAPLPATARDFDYYDAVILGDVNPLTLPARFTRLLSDFVSEQGGGLIITGGAEVFSTGRDPDLQALLPVILSGESAYRESKYKVVLTPEGAQNPVFHLSADWVKNRALWHSLPELSTICLFERAKPGAVVLAVHPQLANDFGQRIVAAGQRFGKGQVLVLGTDSTWNWAFQESRPGFDNMHEQFWRQAVRSVARRPEANAETVGLRPAKEIWYEGDTVRLRLTLPPEMRAPKVTGEITGPEGKKEALVFDTSGEATFLAPRTGAYQVSASADGRTFATVICVQSGLPEFENPAVDNTLLRDLAENTGGKFAYVNDLAQLVKSIRPLKRPAAQTFEWESTSSRWLAGLILALWTSEWILRKLKNLA